MAWFHQLFKFCFAFIIMAGHNRPLELHKTPIFEKVFGT